MSGTRKHLLRDLPIKRKLTFITMLTSGVALVLACLAFVAYELIVFKKTMVSDHLSTAKMVGDNSSAALSFSDPASAEQTLRALSAHPHVMVGAIYDKEGKRFAVYRRPDVKQDLAPSTARPEGYGFGDDHLELFRHIDLAGESIGTVYLRSDLGEMRTRLRRYTLIVIAVVATSSFVAFLVSSRLHRVISGPISHLAEVSSAVATDKNYSIRAVKGGEDELGRLIDGFNEMLAQIQARDAGLQEAQNLLEKRVEERTQALQNEVLERQRSEDVLRATFQRFEMVTRATTDVIWDWRFDNDTVWRNENCQTVFGHSAGQVGFTVENWNALIHPDDRPAVQSSVQEVIESGRHLWHGEYRFRRHDGTYAHVFDRGYVLHDTEGRPVRMIGAMQDITTRKLAATELEEAHKQLLETSRLAGMAEVATGVLHNVGNVLNSVNVSATLVTDSLKRSKLANLRKAVALIREHITDLSTFLASDPKGQQLPHYLGQLAEHLAAEEAVVLNEVESLRKNIEHIKDIVAMQQSYAKVSGVVETITITDLVEDSLNINATALNRHGVRLFREYETRPRVSVEKHKVLQILVNLIRNAKYACDESQRADKRITVRIASRENRVRISIADNGVGIPPENLTRIFAHGFTTKRTGHGFGLHSGALAAKELGGSLGVHSDGVGHGATFTLELPLQP